MNPTVKTVNEALHEIELSELPDDHPRRLAREAVARHRQVRVRAAIDPTYDFTAAPKELRAIMYGGALRFRKQSWWSRLLRRR